MMYARLLEECYSSSSSGKLTYAEVFRLPKGLNAMYALYFSRAFGKPEEKKWATAKLLIALAMCAREPLPINLATTVLAL
jgi:hypothetical protein